MNSNIKELVSQLTLEEKAGFCSGKDHWHLKSIEEKGIPEIMVCDGPHGLRKQNKSADMVGINPSIVSVCYPSAAGIACSFDRKLIYELGVALGKECVAEDVAVLLGPGANIKRSPLCGRNFEYYSEDPFLTGELAAAYINGVQNCGIGTCIKHFAVNNQEYRRMSISAELDERTLREIYLTAFEIAVKKAHP
jgi:beta-glucosidase